MTRTVFVDRDGTLNVDQRYGVDPYKLALRPGARDAVQRWKRAGFRIVVVTNQSGIARGNYTVEQMHRFHEALQDALGAELDAFYWCPHRPFQGCVCRKPRPGLLVQAARDLDVDLERAFMVGDSWVDVGAGRALGLPTVLVPSLPEVPGEVVPDAPVPTVVMPDLDAAARWTEAYA